MNARNWKSAFEGAKRRWPARRRSGGAHARRRKELGFSKVPRCQRRGWTSDIGVDGKTWARSEYCCCHSGPRSICGLFVASWSIVQPTVRHVIRKGLEYSTVHDFQMPSVAALDDAARGQAPKCPAHGPERHCDVFTDVGSGHREIYLGRTFTSGGLKLFKQLKEHRNFGKGLPLRKEERVTLRLTELLAELADNMKFQAGIRR